MLKTVKKQYNYRRTIKKYELKVRILKTIIAITCDKDVRYVSTCLFTKWRNNWKAGRIRNLCFLTGRTRGTSQKWQLSRMMIREFGHAGFFSGFRKASW